MFDVITRKIDFINAWSAEFTMTHGFSISFILQDLEWHLHGALLLLTFGYGYLLNAHVQGGHLPRAARAPQAGLAGDAGAC